jgi:site-specific DNA-cytosine methylase
VLSVGGMFSGIGMWELGLERAGMRVLWHAERDPFRRRVLRHNWPDVPCYPDVRYIGRHNLAPADGQGQRPGVQPDRAPLGPVEAGPARNDAHRLRKALPDAARALHRAQPRRGPRGRLDSPERWRDAGRRAGWDAEPGVGRVVDGRPSRLDRHRLDALGNALVPQIAEAVGRRILEWEGGVT